VTIVDDNKFGPPIRISQIPEDIAVIVAQWGPAYKDTTHVFFVRNVQVARTTITEEIDGRLYRWCVFPDNRVLLVNEGNIRSKRMIKGYGNGR
jgi:hypothetical protein